MIQVDLKRRYLNGQQKLATCLAKKLQNELKRKVARFTTPSNLSQQSSCSESCLNAGFWLDTITRESRYAQEVRLLLQKTSVLSR